MAYIEATRAESSTDIIKERLLVISADGRIQKAIPWEGGQLSVSRWLDNDRLIVSSGKESIEAIYAINVVTGQKRILHNELPDLYTYHPLPNWEDSGITVYDPTLTYVIYPTLGFIHEVAGDFAYVLFNIQTGNVVAVVPSYDLTHAPIWSYEGNRFVIAANDDPNAFFNFELFIVEIDGRINKSTNLSIYYPTHDIQQYSWSRDGRYIAFWFIDVNPGPIGEEQLAVLEIFSRKVTVYCIQGDYDFWGTPSLPMFSTPVPAPVWSPDGKQLLVENRYSVNASRVILVDLSQGYAAKVGENMEPVGWMVLMTDDSK